MMLNLLTKRIYQRTPRSIWLTKLRQVSGKDENQPLPTSEILSTWSQKLREAEVGDIEFNLKCLTAHVLKMKFNTLPNIDTLTFNVEQLKEFERLCEARCARMPLQHIIGEWDFCDLTLKMAPTVFIPRPVTEEFVQKVINAFRNEKSVEMLEVGCGSGAMSLAILNALPAVRATAIERSRAATALAWENANLVGLQDRFQLFNHTMEKHSYLPEELADKTFDLIISNPPYVKTIEFQLLQPEVLLYENMNALDGGPDGLRVARLVFDLACKHLRPGGKLWLEVGNEHPPMVKTIMSQRYKGRLQYIAGYKDQYDSDRFVQIEKI